VITVRAPAKVNLQLAVGPRRADGYHELVTVFHAVDLEDELTVERGSAGIQLTISGEGETELPADASNLAVRAVSLLADRYGITPAVRLSLRKAIPVAAGLAGGSANAAAALVGCAALWETGTAALPQIAAELGSDVPFALAGGTAIGIGRGEQLTSVLTRTTLNWVLAFADSGLSTPDVYARFDELRGNDVPKPEVDTDLLFALRAGDTATIGRHLSNDLQAAAISLRPQLGQLLTAGEDYGALGALVSGSGPTCAFLARNEPAAIDLAVALSATGLCRTVRRAIGAAPGASVIR
jgi:4-diphosphocytidyl-2-C-methyl-D-erythritol kinase